MAENFQKIQGIIFDRNKLNNKSCIKISKGQADDPVEHSIYI